MAWQQQQWQQKQWQHQQYSQQGQQQSWPKWQEPQQPQQQPKPLAWTCCICSADNLAKSKCCKGCKATRLYGDNQGGPCQVLPGNGGAAPQLVLSGPRGAAQIAKHLAELPAAEGASGTDVAGQRVALSARIAQLEALAADGASAALQTALTGEADALKKQLTQSKPLGAQLDGAKAALARARTRHEALEAVASDVQTQLKASVGDILRIQASVFELESEIAREVGARALPSGAFPRHFGVLYRVLYRAL